MKAGSTSAGFWSLRCWVGLWLAGIGTLLHAADWSPTERTDQPWKVASLLEGGGLGHLNIFNLDFERNTNSSRWGTAWIATSDGLHEYDGYTWRRHSRAQGLPSDFVRCVLVTRTGDLWVGTDQGAGLYDGKTFRTMGTETNLVSLNVRRITEDSDGTIWFCSDSWPNTSATGGLTALQDGRWRTYREQDGLPSGYVVNYFRDRAGHQFAATLKGLAQFDGSRWARAFPPPPGQFNWGSGCLAETPQTGLLYSTGRQLFQLQDGGWRQLGDGISHEHGIAATAEGTIVAVGRPNRGRSVFLEWTGNRWSTASAEFSTPRGYTEDIRVAPDGAVWVAGYDCLVRWNRRGSQWREFTDLPPPKLVDSLGGVWFARTRGIIDPAGPAVRLFRGRWELVDRPLDELVDDRRDGSVWGWSSNRLTRWQGTNRTDYTTAQTGLESYAAGHADNQRAFWLLGRTAGGNVTAARIEAGQWRTVPVPELASLTPWRTAASSSNGVWFGGNGGVGSAAVLVRVSPAGNLRLDAPARNLGLYGMNFLEDRFGAIWLYGDTGLFRWVLGKSTQWETLGELPSSQVVTCVERGDELWFGYNGATGGRSTLIALRNGVWTNFAVATLGNLTLAGDGTLLADGVGQIFRVPNRPGAVPVTLELPTAEAVRGAHGDEAGNLWFGNGDSVFQFRSSPLPLRLALMAPDRIHAYDQLPVAMTVRDRFQPRVGEADAVMSYRIDDGDWSPLLPVESFKVDATRLKAGPHRLEAFCQDAVGNRQSQAAVHHFQVLPVPVQERAWFVPGMLGLAALMTALALVTLNARRRLAGYARTLEHRVAERTAELEQDIRRREAVETSLRASEERFVRLFQSGPVMASVASLPDGRLLDANRQFSSVFGYTREEVIGRTSSSLGLWQRPEQLEEMLEQVQRLGGVQNLEVNGRTRTGVELALLVSAEQVDLAGGRAVLIYAVDITGRRRAEDALRLQQRYAESSLRLSRKLERAESLADLLKALREEVEMVIGFRRVWFYLFSEDCREFVLTGTDEGTAPPATSTAGFRLRTDGDAMLEEMVAARNIVVVDDARTDPRTNKAIVAELGNRTLVNVPVHLAHGRLGAFGTGSFGEEGVRQLAAGEREYLAALGSHAAAVLDRLSAAQARAAAETARRETEDRLSLALHAAHLGAWEVDLADHTAHRTLLHGAIFGYSPPLPKWSYEHFLEHVLPEDRAEVDRQFNHAITTFASWDQECRIRRADGVVRWIRVVAGFDLTAETRPTRVSGIVMDVTERKEAEAALRSKDELLRQVIDLVPHFIFAKDRNSRYLFANRAVADSLGMTPEQLVGRGAADLPRTPAEAEAFLRDDREVIVSGQPKFVPAEKLTDVHGRVRIHQTTKIPFRLPGTKEPALLGVAIEITEQQRMERLLEWEMHALERLLSNATLGELLAELALGVEQQAPGALCSILLLDDDGRRLRHGAAPSLPEAYNQAIDGISIGPTVGSCGTAVATGRQVIVTDIAADPLWVDFRELALSHGLRSCWSTPITASAGRILGTFAVYYRNPRSPNPAEQDIINRAQHLVGLAIDRKRAEESLQMTRLSVDRAGDSIFWIRRDGRIHYANAAACRSRGYSREELSGMSIFDIDPDHPPGIWEASFEELKQHGTLTLESRHRTRDSRLFPVEVNANYVFIRGDEFSFCFVRDITARRQVERRRALEFAVSRILAESASLANAAPRILEAIGTSEGWEFGELWQWDDTEAKLHCAETWSAAGLQCEPFAAHTRQQVFGSGEGLPGWVHGTGEVVVMPEVEREARFLRKKASAAAGLVGAIAFPLRAEGPIVGVMAFLGVRRMEVDPDLREMLLALGNMLGQFVARKRVQEELRRFVALSPSVIYALRFTQEGLRAYWFSDNLFELTGYQPSESIHGTWWVQHLHPEDRDRVLRETAGIGQLDHQVLEFRFRRKDGSYLSLRDEKRVRRDATGKPLEIIGAWTDITSRVNLEKQLRQAQKMEAIGLLSGGIAHDFNNILGAISGNAQLAVMDLDSGHPAAAKVDEILKASNRATNLVRQILTFARQDIHERRRLDLRPITQESVRLLRATIPAGVELAVLLPSELPDVLGDETQIQQVIINLGANAWHALEAGTGRIAIELAAVTVDTGLAAQNPDLHTGPYLRLRVLDTGKGMDEATLGRIFDPFFTTKPPGKGTGLGLSVVHGIMKAHEGAILVESTPGKGTSFSLYFPAVEPVPAASPRKKPAEWTRGQGEHLLVIDDELPLLRASALMLERLGYRVTSHSDPAAALADFEAHPDAFALVLSDLNMPGKSGLELARRCLARRPDLPILLSSGFITEALQHEAAEAGIRVVVRKPVPVAELAAHLFQCLHPDPSSNPTAPAR